MTTPIPADHVVAELLDKTAIVEHTALYNECWDENRPDEWVATWTPDGVFHLPGAPDTVGADRLRVMIAAMEPAGFVHLTMNPRITVAGDVATQSCAVVLARRHPSRAPGTSEWLTTGRYHDELRRTPEGWRFARRDFRPDASLRGLPRWW